MRGTCFNVKLLNGCIYPFLYWLKNTFGILCESDKMHPLPFLSNFS